MIKVKKVTPQKFGIKGYSKPHYIQLFQKKHIITRQLQSTNGFVSLPLAPILS